MNISLGHTSTFSIFHETLCNILDEMSQHSAVKNSEELSEQVNSALVLSKNLLEEIEPILERRYNLHQSLSNLTRDPDEIISGRTLAISHKIDKYNHVKDEGKSPTDVYMLLKSDDIKDELEIICVLRAVFNLSLIDAQKITGFVKD